MQSELQLLSTWEVNVLSTSLQLPSAGRVIKHCCWQSESWQHLLSCCFLLCDNIPELPGCSAQPHFQPDAPLISTAHAGSGSFIIYISKDSWRQRLNTACWMQGKGQENCFALAIVKLSARYRCKDSIRSGTGSSWIIVCRNETHGAAVPPWRWLDLWKITFSQVLSVNFCSHLHLVWDFNEVKWFPNSSSPDLLPEDRAVWEELMRPLESICISPVRFPALVTKPQHLEFQTTLGHCVSASSSISPLFMLQSRSGTLCRVGRLRWRQFAGVAGLYTSLSRTGCWSHPAGGREKTQERLVPAVFRYFFLPFFLLHFWLCHQISTTSVFKTALGLELRSFSPCSCVGEMGETWALLCLMQ